MQKIVRNNKEIKSKKGHTFVCFFLIKLLWCCCTTYDKISLKIREEKKELSEFDIDILNLENRILEDRRVLNDLIYRMSMDKSKEVNSELMKDKLHKLQSEVEFLSKQLDLLNSVGIKEENQNIQSARQENPKQDAAVTVKTDIQPNDNKSVAKKRDIEKIFGQSWMGVIASGLIFISIVLAAILLIPRLTNGIKMAAMFILSFAFTIVGLLRLSKDKDNKFNLALSGCGVGAIYISLLISCLYFKAFNEIVLYVFIFVWAIFICILSKTRSQVFQIIGQIGIIISVLFGCSYVKYRYDCDMFLMLEIYFVISSLIFTFAHLDKIFDKNLINLIFNCINLVTLLYTANIFATESIVMASSIIIIIYSLAQIVLCIRMDIPKRPVLYSILNIIFPLLIVKAIKTLVMESEYNETIIGISLLVIGAGMLGVMEWKLPDKKKPERVILQIPMMIIMLIAVVKIPFFDEHISYALLMLPFMLAGFINKDYIYKYGSFVLLLFFECCQVGVWEKIIFEVIYYAILVYLFRKKNELYHEAGKMISYILFLPVAGTVVYKIVSLTEVDLLLKINILYFAISGINLLAIKFGFSQNPITEKKEQGVGILLTILHALMMFFVMTDIVILGIDSRDLMHIIMVIWALILFMANSKELLEKHTGMGAGIYVGLKFTILLTVILSSFETANFVISIGLFLLAIVFIVIGFMFQYKSLRVYGLILSMLSVLKLVMVDMAYGKLSELALGFFASGILCFVISLIYNTIDKKVKK